MSNDHNYRLGPLFCSAVDCVSTITLILSSSVLSLLPAFPVSVAIAFSANPTIVLPLWVATCLFYSTGCFSTDYFLYSEKFIVPFERKISSLFQKIKNKISPSRSMPIYPNGILYNLYERISEHILEFIHIPTYEPDVPPLYHEAIVDTSNPNGNPPEYNRIFAQNGDVEILVLEGHNNDDILYNDNPPNYNDIFHIDNHSQPIEKINLYVNTHARDNSTL